MLALPKDQIAQTGVDPGGTRVLEAYLKGHAPPFKKRKMMRKLQGTYGAAALKAAGSFLVETCYESAVWAQS
jgi:hypothetical protein